VATHQPRRGGISVIVLRVSRARAWFDRDHHDHDGDDCDDDHDKATACPGAPPIAASLTGDCILDDTLTFEPRARKTVRSLDTFRFRRSKERIDLIGSVGRARI
jgi:hypothetical protein